MKLFKRKTYKFVEVWFLSSLTCGWLLQQCCSDYWIKFIDCMILLRLISYNYRSEDFCNSSNKRITPVSVCAEEENKHTKLWLIQNELGKWDSLHKKSKPCTIYVSYKSQSFIFIDIYFIDIGCEHFIIMYISCMINVSL